MRKIQVELCCDDVETIKQVRSLDDFCLIAEPDHFEGGIEIITAIVSVTTASIPVLTKIIRSHITSKKYIKVKMKGVEISGASLKDIAKFLNEIKSTK